MRHVLFFLLLAAPLQADDFFEAKIRPVLVEHCQRCHGEKQAKGGLRLDSRAALVAGGDSGPAIVAKEPAKSRLVEALKYANVDLQMPPKGKLPEAVIKDFEKWIADGAAWPDDGKAAVKASDFDLAKRKAEHWCWQPIKQYPVPAVKNEAWPRDPVDRFLLAKLEEKGLKPAAEAPKLVWLRRVSFAITGLPPTPEEIAAFEKDDSPQAYEKVADRLQASPHYGERWGRHWLDLVRYAESRGHEFDFDNSNVWLYRDYVIRAFNEDLPYDQFATEQICGTLKQGSRFRGRANESIIGTAFWRLGEEVQSPVDIRQDQADRFDNRIDVYSKTFLGLTLACARCHDHKFDAIGTRDYYALFAMLQGGSDTPIRVDSKCETRPLGRMDVASLKANRNDSGSADAAYYWNGSAMVLHPAAKTLRIAGQSHPEAGELGTIPRAGLTLRSPQFTLECDNLYYLVRGGGRAYAAVGGHTLINGPLHAGLVLKIKDSREFRWVAHPLKDYKGQRFRVELIADPKTDFAVMAIAQGNDPPSMIPPLNAIESPPDAEFPPEESRLVPGVIDGVAPAEYVFIRGGHKTPGALVPPSFLEAIDGRPTAERSPALVALAQQTIDADTNPLFPRVMVNRVWHHLFGRGIVASTDNFGVLGERPTHPELLDYLAAEFRNDYRIKPLIRRLVLSSAFRMGSATENDAKDPANLLLHHFRIKRLEGEAIRDSILQASGRLDRTVGGQPVPMHLTAFLDGRGRPSTSGPVDGAGRRSVYLAVRRNFLSPFLLAFDYPNPFSTVGTRTVSNVPAQSLILMNDAFVHEQAKRWGQEVAGKATLSTDEKIAWMYLQAFGRKPSEAELQACWAFRDETKSWEALAHTLINVKEFRFVP